MVHKDGISNVMDKAFCITGNATGGHRNPDPKSIFVHYLVDHSFFERRRTLYAEALSEIIQHVPDVRLYQI